MSLESVWIWHILESSTFMAGPGRPGRTTRDMGTDEDDTSHFGRVGTFPRTSLSTEACSLELDLDSDVEWKHFGGVDRCDMRPVFWFGLIFRNALSSKVGTSESNSACLPKALQTKTRKLSPKFQSSFRNISWLSLVSYVLTQRKFISCPKRSETFSAAGTNWQVWPTLNFHFKEETTHLWKIKCLNSIKEIFFPFPVKNYVTKEQKLVRLELNFDKLGKFHKQFWGEMYINIRKWRNITSVVILHYKKFKIGLRKL